MLTLTRPAGVQPRRPLRRSALRHVLPAGTAALLVLGTASVAAAPASAAPSTSRACRAPVSATLTSQDPTVIEDAPVVVLRPKPGRRVSRVQVTVRPSRSGKRSASGARSARLGAGTTPVDVKILRGLRKGYYEIVTTASVAGCKGRVRTVDLWTLKRATLPVRVAVRGSATENGSTVVRAVLRSVGAHRPRGLRVALRTSSGRTVARTTVKGALATPADVTLTATGTLPAGTYRVVVSGRSAGTSSRTVQPVVLKAGDDVAATDAPSRQHAVVDWSGGRSEGRDVVGFALPGIGHGELTCSPETQSIRVFPSDLGREASMMNWTYKDWRQNSAKALREGLHARYTGPDFSESFAQFIPSEKQSTGEFVGLLSDRGPIGTAGTAPYAPPISLHVTWVWDFSRAGSERCHAEIDLVAQTPDATPPAVSSAQVVWRGDGAAPGRDTAVTDVPGLGRLTVVCQAGTDGQRTATLETAHGARITTRQATEDGVVPQGAGPIVVSLPNNGQVQVDVDGGGRVLIASRWKVNDPQPGENSCAVAAQAISP